MIGYLRGEVQALLEVESLVVLPEGQSMGYEVFCYRL